MRKVAREAVVSRRALIVGSSALGATATLGGFAPAAYAASPAAMLLQNVPGTPAAPDFTIPDLDGKA
ncbi:MAG: hypothetical protein ABL908_20855, partial [Hyphomicrobium sp.]